MDFDISKAFPGFPYFILGEQEGRRKVAILSKRPLQKLHAGNDLVTAGVVTINDATELRVVTTHPPTGVLPHHLRKRDHAIKAAFAEAADTKFALVMGDFNAAPWSPIMHEMSRQFGFERTRGGVFHSTWITPLPVFGLAIDHIYVSEEIEIWTNGGGPFIGSDHWPISATIGVPIEN